MSSGAGIHRRTL